MGTKHCVNSEGWIGRVIELAETEAELLVRGEALVSQPRRKGPESWKKADHGSTKPD